MRPRTVLVTASLLLSVNCASIIHQTTQQIPVTSDPPGAALTTACGDVFNDPKLITPTAVTVSRKPERCTIGLNKDGYEPTTISLSREVTPWYFANILVGGIVGFIVDAANGAMWDRKPKKIDVKLTPKP